MKQINDLTVCEVPKNAVNFKVSGTSWLRHDTEKYPGVWDAHIQLPPGQYEIIGLYSEVDEDEHKLIDIAMAADLRLSESIHDMLSQHSIPLPTDTTDLLFIHKIK